MSTLEPTDLSIEQYWQLLELSADGVWMWDIANDSVSWSPGLSRALGLPASEMKRLDIIALTHPDDRERHAAAIDEHLASSGVYSTEVRLRHSSGDYRSFMARGFSERNSDGTAKRMLGFIVDTSDAHLQRSALESSENRFRAFVDNCPAAAYMKAPDGRHLYVNEAAAKLAGTTPEGMLGNRNSDIFPPETAQRLQEVDDGVLASGKLRSWTGILAREDGSQRWVHDVKFPVETADHTVSLGGFGFDITELRQAQTTIENIQRMESIGRLAGGVAHDFNNVLAVILGYCKVMRTTVEDEHPLAVPLDGIESAARRSANLTRALLAFARRQAMNPHPLDLREELERVKPILLPLVGSSISLEIESDPNLWAVKLDPSQFDQVITNLCINARHAITGTGTIRIELRNETWSPERAQDQLGAEPGDYVRFSVIDDGMGMNADQLDNLFEPFYTTKPHGEGTGLGLSTVHGIVQQNCGRIEVESECGSGSKLHIYLRRELSPVDSMPDDSDLEVPTGQGELVLIVDDEVDLLRITRVNLESIGYRVLTARSPEEALEIAKDSDLDVLVTDVVMPRMSGPELAKRICEVQPGITLILMSGHADEALVDASTLGPSAEVLQKPFSPDELARSIAGAIAAE